MLNKYEELLEEAAAQNISVDENNISSLLLKIL